MKNGNPRGMIREEREGSVPEGTKTLRVPHVFLFPRPDKREVGGSVVNISRGHGDARRHSTSVKSWVSPTI